MPPAIGVNGAGGWLATGEGALGWLGVAAERRDTPPPLGVTLPGPGWGAGISRGRSALTLAPTDT
jgi:hypothetical protein